MKKRSVLRCWAILFAVILFCVMLITLFFFYKVRPLIYTVARSQAETIMLNSSSSSVLKILEDEDISYDTLSRVSRDSNGAVQSIEIDTNKMNYLKNCILKEIPLAISRSEFYNISIPLGTLTGMETLSGFGPRISIPTQLTSTVVTDYKSRFVSEGINQTLHQILINIDLRCNIVMLGFTDGFSVSTNEIAAQTVIVGAVPDTFTNVIETPTDDIADEIFNFAN